VVRTYRPVGRDEKSPNGARIDFDTDDNNRMVGT